MEQIGVEIQSLNYYDMYWSEKGNAEELDVLYKLVQYCVNGNIEEDSYYNYYYYDDTIQTTQVRKQVLRNIRVTYKLKNGNEVSRQYRIDLLAEESFWHELYAKTGFASAQFADILNMFGGSIWYMVLAAVGVVILVVGIINYFSTYMGSKNGNQSGLAGKVKYAQLLFDGSEILFEENNPEVPTNLSAIIPDGAVKLQLPVNLPQGCEVPVIEIFMK